ncbi:hypothetical protein BGX24_009387 [Mortierella sp. AD032]|nr:hypothetical protein BGX24_009387 [Mortierella sp. AD032]
MASQPLVASFYVDYLSHPLSSEHLLVCYQQITRQIAHAPLSAKDAAFSFQHQSQAMIELLGQHQTLAVPQTKERPAPPAGYFGLGIERHWILLMAYDEEECVFYVLSEDIVRPNGDTYP